MRAIDADALIADLEYDVERDAKALDSIDSVGRDWETIWFDKNCKQNAIDLLQRAPTIEPQHRKGRWIPKFNGMFKGGAYWFKCSECERTVPEVRNGGWNYCPNCGADMTEGEG